MSYEPTEDPPEPIGLTGFTPSNTAPAAISGTSFTPSNSPAVPIGWNGQAPGLPTMPSVFTPAFIELTGEGPSLATLIANAADATAGRILTGTVGGQLKNYQVRTGTDAQELPGIVHPANFDADENPVVFVSL